MSRLSHPDWLFRVLSDPLRRDLLWALHTREESDASVAELADELATPATGATAAAVESALHHHHLPLLEAVGVVVYDPSGRSVRYEPEPALTEVLETGVLERE